MTTKPSEARVAVTRSLIIAGLLITASFVLKLLSPAYLSPEFTSRLAGIMLGVVVVIYANAVPKTLTPLIAMRADPAAEQAIRRFTGWSLTLGGVGYLAAWAVAPLASANGISARLLALALVVAVARMAWGMRGPRS